MNSSDICDSYTCLLHHIVVVDLLLQFPMKDNDLSVIKTNKKFLSHGNAF